MHVCARAYAAVQGSMYSASNGDVVSYQGAYVYAAVHSSSVHYSIVHILETMYSQQVTVWCHIHYTA